jgi:ElaB/YqjD/DUF883 family membrane-anchored ribosome-binding protein
MNDVSSDGKVVKELMDGRDWVAERLTRADQQARSFLTEHPILAIACAVGIGYLAARLLRPRSRT